MIFFAGFGHVEPPARALLLQLSRCFRTHELLILCIALHADNIAQKQDVCKNLRGSLAAQHHPALAESQLILNADQELLSVAQPSGNINFEGELNFKVGNGLFRKIWVSSPASTLASDGLGPLFNAPSCQRRHLKPFGKTPALTTYLDASQAALLRYAMNMAGLLSTWRLG